jgi:zinc/manganese transport system substrate-binding protein
MRAGRLALLALAFAVALAGCTTTAADPPGKIYVVASTNVYGSLASTVGGSYAQVTSIIDDPAKDPHEYQADARTQLAVSTAQVIIENGGGYDDFVDTMISASGNTRATVINAVKLSGYDASADDFNEHVFYDYPTMMKVVDSIVAAFTRADPSHGAVFANNGTELHRQLSTLEASEKNFGVSTSGVGVAITEPVPDYVLDALGMTIVTPTKFSKAIEDGTDAPAAVLEQTLQTFASHDAKVLVYNEQTGGPQTDAVLAAAKKAGVPAVPVSETLPAGLSYIQWQKKVLTSIAAAVAK